MIVTQTEADWLLEHIDSAQLNDWEIEFVASLRRHRLNGTGLTVRQIETLSRIWDRQN